MALGKVKSSCRRLQQQQQGNIIIFFWRGSWCFGIAQTRVVCRECTMSALHNLITQCWALSQQLTRRMQHFIILSSWHLVFCHGEYHFVIALQKYLVIMFCFGIMQYLMILCSIHLIFINRGKYHFLVSSTYLLTYDSQGKIILSSWSKVWTCSQHRK